MADLTITAANVVAGSGSTKKHGTAGASVTAGQVVYLDSATNTYKLADSNSGTAAVRSPAGIALHASANGQPLTILTAGPITIGATVAASAVYVLSGTAGGIAPASDITTGIYTAIIGVATSTTVIDVKIHEAGVASA